MAEIVAFPTDSADFSDEDFEQRLERERFLLDEGLELLAQYRSILDEDVRASLRALVKSLALQKSKPDA